MKVYECGAFTGLSKQEFNSWRVGASMMLEGYEIDCINPANFYNTEDSIPGTYTEKEVRMFDLNAVRHCDLVLVNLNHNSIGSAIEMHEAEINHIPIIGFGANESSHPWLLDMLDKLCNTLEEAVEYIGTYENVILSN